MSLIPSRPATAAQTAARRANARKSRGPRTLRGKRIASLNAMKSGGTAQPATRPVWQSMAALGEDPARYQSLLRDTVNSFLPRTPMELSLCEEITHLRLKLERNRQAQEAKVVRTHEALERSRERSAREMERGASYDAPQAEVLERGLRSAPASPAKFSEVTACLDALRKRIGRGDFSDETEIEALYGKKPSLRGAGILSAFRELAAQPDDRPLASALRMMILEEVRDNAEEAQCYYREHVEISRAMRLECLAPAGDREYLQLQRQENWIHRQIERKIKLLVIVQKECRRAPDDAEACDLSLAPSGDGPVGWIEPADARSRAKESVPPPQRSTGRGEERAIALRHKLAKINPAATRDQKTWAETVRLINQVYGIEEPLAPAGSGTSQAHPASVVRTNGKSVPQTATRQGHPAPGVRTDGTGETCGPRASGPGTGAVGADEEAVEASEKGPE